LIEIGGGIFNITNLKPFSESKLEKYMSKFSTKETQSHTCEKTGHEKDASNKANDCSNSAMRTDNHESSEAKNVKKYEPMVDTSTASSHFLQKDEGKIIPAQSKFCDNGLRGLPNLGLTCYM
jgi:hypothetical protein